jgi:integration host factor subunit alpha
MSKSETLTRAELSEHLHERIGLSRAECRSIVESVLENMAQSLATGDLVKIAGFGTFQVRAKTARIGRNPKTGVEVPITPRKVLTFRPSQKMRDQINAGR